MVMDLVAGDNTGGVDIENLEEGLLINKCEKYEEEEQVISVNKCGGMFYGVLVLSAVVFMAADCMGEMMM